MLWPRWIWLRALGLIFLSVFYSLAFQIEGLVGPRGILPAAEYLPEVREAVGAWKAAWYAPTLFLLGAAASALLVLNVAPRACIAVAGICFLSFVAAAQDFSGYQSDGMLLEAAFLSLLLAPRGLRPGLGAADPPSRFAVFMLLWEWFRIYFESGVVKLLSGDAQWRNFTALDHYYENGPLPSCARELVLVWLAFFPRQWRIACFLLVSPFQAIIILTANYAFLNYIVLCLGVLLLDDRFLARVGLPAPDVPLPRAGWPARIALGWIFAA